MNKKDKSDIIAKLSKDFKEAKSVALVDFAGMNTLRVAIVHRIQEIHKLLGLKCAVIDNKPPSAAERTLLTYGYA